MTRESVKPTLWFQGSFPIISVIVYYCVNERLVVVRVGLRTDECAIQTYINLFEQQVNEIVTYGHQRVIGYVTVIVQFEL